MLRQPHPACDRNLSTTERLYVTGTPTKTVNVSPEASCQQIDKDLWWNTLVSHHSSSFFFAREALYSSFSRPFVFSMADRTPGATAPQPGEAQASTIRVLVKVETGNFVVVQTSGASFVAEVVEAAIPKLGLAATPNLADHHATQFQRDARHRAGRAHPSRERTGRHFASVCYTRNVCPVRESGISRVHSARVPGLFSHSLHCERADAVLAI